MKFLNSFLCVGFLLVAICAVLSFAKPKGNTEKLPIELKFFDKADPERCAYDGCSDGWDFSQRLLFEKVSEDFEETDGDNVHRISYKLGKRVEGDILLLNAVQGDPDNNRAAESPRWGPGIGQFDTMSVSVTAIELNVNQTTPQGVAYLKPFRPVFFLGVELVNGKPLGYDMKVYGFYVRKSEGFGY